MRRRILLALAAVVLCAGSSAFGQASTAPTPTRTERLISGEQKTFAPGYAVGDIAISNPAVCDFRVVSNRRELLLIATGAGFATLTIWDQKGVKRDEMAIEVVSREQAKLMSDLLELIRPYSDVSVKSLGSRIVLAGTVNSAQELEAIRTIAGADSRILSTVTVKGAAPQAETPPRPVPIPSGADTAATPTRPASPALPTTPSIVVDPAPPPPNRPIVNAPAPVPLAPAATSNPNTPPPAAVVAAPAPPPPNIAPVDATRLPSRPGTTPAGAPAESVSIEYQIEIYESPATAPPPEVMGPQGTRLFSGRLIASPGTEAQQVVTVGDKPSSPAAMKGIRVAVTPTISGSAIQSAVVIDTNLPVGQYAQQKTPVWLRSQLAITSASGQKRYITEADLARVATPTGAPPASTNTGGSGAGGRLAATAADAGASAVSSATGVGYIPSLGGLFGGGGGNKQPKARPTMLLIVVTATVSAAPPR